MSEDEKLEELKQFAKDEWVFKVDLMLDDFKKAEERIENLEADLDITNMPTTWYAFRDRTTNRLNELTGKINDLQCLYENHYHKTLESVLKDHLKGHLRIRKDHDLDYFYLEIENELKRFEDQKSDELPRCPTCNGLTTEKDPISDWLLCRKCSQEFKKEPKTITIKEALKNLKEYTNITKEKIRKRNEEDYLVDVDNCFLKRDDGCAALDKLEEERKEFVEKLLKLRKDNTVESPNFATADRLLRGIDKIIKEYSEK